MSGNYTIVAVDKDALDKFGRRHLWLLFSVHVASYALGVFAGWIQWG